MKKTLLILASALLASANSLAQVSKPLNSAEILLGLQKLNTVGSVLYVAAHPDDENTRLLAYLASEKKLRTAYLSLTRGDGGQNLIGKEQGAPLGLIRTQELLAARRKDGAEQFFSRANDFGYSKNPDETFSFWNKDSILSDVVLCIRKFKPDVIICRFPTTGEGGHGHHTASAILALEAFDAAADPTRFPEQLSFTQVWQAKRIFWNTFNFGGTNTTAPDQLKMDVGVYNPLLGKSFGEIASESRSMHKSQGFGSANQRGSNIEFFKLLKGETATSDVMDGVNCNWKKFKEGDKIETTLNRCIAGFDAQHPEKSLTDLIAVYKELQAQETKNKELLYWKQQKLKECENLLMACSGLWLEAYAADFTGIPGDETTFTVQVVNRNKNEVTLRALNYFNQSDSSCNLVLKQNEMVTIKHKEKIALNSPYSNPYWLNEKHEAGRYTVNNPALKGRPENDPFLKVRFDLSIQDLDLKIMRDLIYKNTDPVKGEVYRPFEILPPVSINISEKSFVFADNKEKSIQLIVKANKANTSGKLQLKSTAGWNLSFKDSNLTLVNKGDEAIVDVKVSATANAAKGKLEVSFSSNGNTYNKSIKRIEYDHIPFQFILSDAEAALVKVDVKKAGLKIAYINGAGDEVAGCLEQMGYELTFLTDAMIKSDDLSAYSAIVTGVRAYNTNERLQVYYNKLMDYVKNGGNLVVQYNTNSRVGPLQAKIGPYPFTISRDRVTDEKAVITLSNEKHPALNFPNKISGADFEGWVQERGIYFASDVDAHYETVLSMNDPGEKASSGSLITAKYGKGNFVYTGLVFFRELPAGVPGAYRLFANLLSLPKND